MDELLGKLAGQAVSLAGKAAFGLVTKVALEQVNKVIKKAPVSQADKLNVLINSFQQKVNILNPAIELLEIALSRGNKALENIVEMTDLLQTEIQKFNNIIALQYKDQNSSKVDPEISVKTIEQLKDLITLLDSTTSYIQLTLSIVDVKVGSDLPKGISPSRLLQASALVTATDHSVLYGKEKHYIVGKDLSFTLYRLFTASSRPKGKEDFTWKEEYAKCSGHAERGKDPKLYSYDLVLTENFNDDRYHEEDQIPQKRIVSVSDIKRLYYSSSGSLLNIEDLTSPVLVLKIEDSNDKEKTPEWLAIGIYSSVPDENDSVDKKLEALELSESTGETSKDLSLDQKELEISSTNVSVLHNILPFPPQRCSGQPRNSALSLFEYILRITAAEVSQQKPHLLIPDEHIARFLQDDQIASSPLAK